MKKIIGLDAWTLSKTIRADKRKVTVSIHLKRPPLKLLLSDTPAQRNQKIALALKSNFKKLVGSAWIESYSRIGTAKKPGGIKTKIPYSALQKVAALNSVDHVFIHHVSGARIKKNTGPLYGFYTVKMTVAIEIEGQKKGLQTFEERFILIKAKSFDDACTKIEKQKKWYAEPYLNAKGELVRWRIESLDDCFATGIHTADELNNTEGIEVYSLLKRRKLTPDRYWNGK